MTGFFEGTRENILHIIWAFDIDKMKFVFRFKSGDYVVLLQNAKLLKLCLNEERDKYISFILLVVGSSLLGGLLECLFESAKTTEES